MKSEDSAAIPAKAEKRYDNIDKLKVLCAFLIVCIHAPFNGVLGEYFTALTRIAVPVFLIISGYFYKSSTVVKQIKKIALLFLEANILYFIFGLLIAALKGNCLIFIKETFTLKKILEFIILNEDPLQMHLWYLGAILYVLIIVMFLERAEERFGINIKRILFSSIPFFLIGDLVLGKYSILLLGHEKPYIIVRNWLFVGLPYFVIGMLLKEKETIIRKISKWKLLVVIAFSALTTLLERYLLVSNNYNAKRDHYISTTFLAVSVFLFYMYYVQSKESILSRLGRNDSTWIYILHPMVISVLRKAFEVIGVSKTINYIFPIVIFAVTALTVEVITMIKKKLSEHIS